MCALLPVKKTFSTSICFAHSQETLLHYQPNKIGVGLLPFSLDHRYKYSLYCLYTFQTGTSKENFFNRPLNLVIIFCILMTVILYSGGDTVIRIYMLVTVRGERVTENWPVAVYN